MKWEMVGRNGYSHYYEDKIKWDESESLFFATTRLNLWLWKNIWIFIFDLSVNMATRIQAAQWEISHFPTGPIHQLSIHVIEFFRKSSRIQISFTPKLYYRYMANIILHESNERGDISAGIHFVPCWRTSSSNNIACRDHAGNKRRRIWSNQSPHGLPEHKRSPLQFRSRTDGNEPACEH